MTFATDAFLEPLQLEAEQRGLPELPRVAISHPLGGIPAEEAERKARAVVDDVIPGLLGR